jgi:cation:H+ antiporter
VEIITLFIALVTILIGAQAFTNALEHLGERLGISEGVTGSIFAAVGTALPETVPIFAIFSSVSSLEVRQDVGIGAILGAPLMLSTLAFCLMAGVALRSRGWQGRFNPEPSGLSRDMKWFTIVYVLGFLAVLIPPDWQLIRGSVSLLLVLLYGLYLLVTIRASSSLVEEGHGTEADHALYLSIIGLPHHMIVILCQLGIGFVLIMLGAKGFVQGVESLSNLINISALTLSLLIIPVATELPENVNSIILIRRGRDTLAFGNITGAMVFQGSLLPALGILLTPWVPNEVILMGMGMTLLASTYLFIVVRSGPLKVYHLALNGACYIAFVVAVLLVD